MPSLLDIFREYELDQLEMIAEQWGLEEAIDWRIKPDEQIAAKLADIDLFSEIISTLPISTQKTYQELIVQGGKIVRQIFKQSHGDLREMGAAIREKERPDRKPISDTETLYYRGLIALAFFEIGGETKEYFFIPDEFAAFLATEPHSSQNEQINPLEKPVIKKIKPNLATGILELIAFRLAILRGKIPPSEFEKIIPPDTIPFVDALLLELNIIEEDQTIQADKLPSILLDDVESLLPELFACWQESEKINDLKFIPTLTFEGQWINDPIKPRKTILEIFRQLPANTWFRLGHLTEWVYDVTPHFLRSGGEFEQWFIKEKGKEEFIKGFSSWPVVDGAFVRFLITGPLHWFGLTSIGSVKNPESQIVFKKTEWADMVIDGQHPSCPEQIPQKATFHKNGDVYIPRFGNREMLYQMARIFTWIGKNDKFYKFRVTSATIPRAEKQSFTQSQLKMIINKFGQNPIPANILSAVDRWVKHGPEIRIEEQVIVRLKNKNILNLLDPNELKKLVVEEIDPATVIIHKKDIQKLENRLQEAGFLVENLTKYNQETE